MRLSGSITIVRSKSEQTLVAPKHQGFTIFARFINFLQPQSQYFYGRKQANLRQSIYGKSVEKRRKFWCIMIKIRKLNKFEQKQKTQ